jgi:hypothetical protein
MSWPLITLEGARPKEAVKSPMSTELERARALRAVPDEPDALALK